MESRLYYHISWQGMPQISIKDYKTGSENNQKISGIWRRKIAIFAILENQEKQQIFDPQISGVD